MKKELKTLWIAVVVLAVLQLIGGIAYTSWTAHCERQYTYVDCTVVSVSTSQGEEEGALTVEGITVSYVASGGETVIAEMEDFPSSFAIGESFRGRYSDDPTLISAKTTDWFTPVFLIILGAMYALAAAVMFILRKKMGLYAMESPDETFEDDGEYDVEDENIDDPDDI